MQAAEWKKDYEEFEEVTRQFYAGEVPSPKYKGFSGGFGSYAQRGGKASMLRLRLPGGRVDREKLGFVVRAVEKYKIDKVHFTTCQTIQLHNPPQLLHTEIRQNILPAQPLKAEIP